MTQINVILGGKTIYEGGVPSVIGGDPAVMDTDALEKRTFRIDDKIEKTEVTEYWLKGELVHRSVDMHLKTGIFAEGVVADFGVA